MHESDTRLGESLEESGGGTLEAEGGIMHGERRRAEAVGIRIMYHRPLIVRGALFNAAASLTNVGQSCEGPTT